MNSQPQFFNDGHFEPPVHQFANMNLNGGQQQKFKPGPGQQLEIAARYEGWSFTKAPAAVGEASTWSEAFKNPLAYEQEDLAKMVKKLKGKTSVDKQRSGLKSKNQRFQIDRLLEEKRKQERHPEAEWILAGVKDVKNKTNSWKPDETVELQVILKRKQRSVDGKVKKKTKNGTTVSQPPGQLVDLKDASKKMKGNAADKGGKSGPAFPQQQLDFGNQHQGQFNQAPRPLPQGAGGFHVGPPNGFQQGPPPLQHPPPPMQQRMQQELPPLVFPNEARQMNRGNAAPIDDFDPHAPIQIVGDPPPFKEPPFRPQFKHERHREPFEEFQTRPRRATKQKGHRPPRLRHDTRRSSPAMYDSSSEFTDSERSGYSFGSGDLHSPITTPITTPTTASFGSSRNKGQRHARGDYFMGRRDKQRHSRSRPRRESHGHRDSIVDMIPGRSDRRHERTTSYPRYPVSRPMYDDRAMTSRNLRRLTEREVDDRHLRKLENVRRDEQRKYDRLRDDEEYYDRERRRERERDSDFERRRGSPRPRYGETSPRRHRY